MASHEGQLKGGRGRVGEGLTRSAGGQERRRGHRSEMRWTEEPVEARTDGDWQSAPSIGWTSIGGRGLTGMGSEIRGNQVRVRKRRAAHWWGIPVREGDGCPIRAGDSNALSGIAESVQFWIDTQGRASQIRGDARSSSQLRSWMGGDFQP